MLRTLSDLVRRYIRAGAYRYGGVTLSLGLATHPAHAPSSTDLIKRADEALYRAKRGGRNRAVVTDSEASPA